MSILVTGASGFVGQHLLRELGKTGARITAGTLSGGPPEGAVETSGGVRWISLDVTSAESVREAIRETRPEQVYHLAAQSSVGGSFRDPLGTWDVNATGTLRLLAELQRQSISQTRFLLISSAEVYGAVLERNQPIAESAPLRPATPYGASKAAAECTGLQASQTGKLEVVIARSFNHAGPGQDVRFALPSMARQLVRIQRGESEPVLRVGNLDARRDFLDVRDVVRAYVCLMERGESGGVYNVCSGEAQRFAKLVESLVRLSGTGARIEVDPERLRPVDIPLLVGDAGRMRALGWAPSIPLEETLSDLLRAEAARVETACSGKGRIGPPLSGKRIVVTRPREQAGGITASLEELGAEVIPFPTIRITDPTDGEPLRRAAAEADRFDWIVFTSVNGVQRFWAELRATGRDTRVLAGVSLCAIGPATAAAIELEGARADLVPEEYVAEAVVAALAEETDLRGGRILIPRAEVARSVLPTSLRERGAEVVEVAAYRTVPDGAEAEGVREQLQAGEVDLITFTASSTVRNFVDLMGAEIGSAEVACIGPITSGTARELGLPVHVEAEEYTIPGLLRAIRTHVGMGADGR